MRGPERSMSSTMSKVSVPERSNITRSSSRYGHELVTGRMAADRELSSAGRPGIRNTRAQALARVSVQFEHHLNILNVNVINIINFHSDVFR
jgi:hypothetical protein